MPKTPSYVIVGRGRWAGRMQAILAAEERRITNIAEARQNRTESEAAYKSRLAGSFQATGAQIAWLCVPPGPHIPLMLEAAMDVGLNAVAEKPWQCSRSATEALQAHAKKTRRLLAVHYEYCLLSQVETWRKTFYPGSGLRFGGRYFLNRPDHLGIPAIENVGSHLLSIRAHAAPESTLSEILCGYERPDERSVWLEKAGTRTAFLNLLENKEPIIQRFIRNFEAALDGGEFPFGLEFALRVAEDVASVR